VDTLIHRLPGDRFEELRELTRSAAKRRKAGQYIVEGPHLVEAALEAKASIEEVLFTEQARAEHDEIFEKAGRAGVKSYQIAEKAAERLSDTQSPQGVFAVVRFPAQSKSGLGNAVLVLDDVQDPGNVGTLLRTASWFGIRDLLLTTGTADPFSPKVLRATQGGVFNMNIAAPQPIEEIVRSLKSLGYQLVATVMESATPIHQFKPKGKYAILLGSEARGLSPKAVEQAEVRVTIPRTGEGESLNVAVAGAIVMWELSRER
jgi:RNA methyltransferase, TrmH family